MPVPHTRKRVVALPTIRSDRGARCDVSANERADLFPVAVAREQLETKAPGVQVSHNRDAGLMLDKSLPIPFADPPLDCAYDGRLMVNSMTFTTGPSTK